MHTFTALYDSREEAEAAQARLGELGIVDIDQGLHGADAAVFEDEAGAIYGEDRHIYREATRRGGFLLTVNVDDAQADRVHLLLDGTHPVDLDERERKMRAEGFAPPIDQEPLTGARAEPYADVDGEQVIPVAEERLRVGKRQVDRGGVRVRAYTIETPVRDEVRLREEHVGVERRPVNARIADAEGLFQDREIAVTETAEEAIVGKAARVVEEVAVRKDVGERVETVRDTVRHTEVEVERVSPTDRG